METVVFSVENGSLVIKDGNISFIDLSVRRIVASTYDFLGDPIHLLPSTLIRTPKSDEELAEESCNKSSYFSDESYKEGFLAGRKSFGDKKFHLSDFGLKLIYNAQSNNTSLYDIIKALNPPIYPHTITVEHDGENYLWETLKAEY